MYNQISLTLLVLVFFAPDIREALLFTSGLFAIAGSIEYIRNKME